MKNKTIKYVDEFSNNNTNQSATLISISTLKNTKQSFFNNIANTIYNHNCLNSVLYFNNLLLSDYYTFDIKYIQTHNYDNNTNYNSFNISNFTYDESTQILKLDSNNTLISCFTLSRYINRYPSISNMTDDDALNEFKYVNIPKTFHFETQNATGDITYGIADSELTYTIDNNKIKHYTIINYKNEEFKNLETDYSYNYIPPTNESNIISEKLAEYFEPSNQNEKPKLYFTIPTFLNYNYLKREFKHLKFCRLSEIPGIRILYYRQANSGVSEHIIDPEDPTEIDYLYSNNINLGNPDKCLIPLDISKIQQTSKKSVTRETNPITKNLLHKILIKHIQEETDSPQPLQDKLLKEFQLRLSAEQSENNYDFNPLFAAFEKTFGNGAGLGGVDRRAAGFSPERFIALARGTDRFGGRRVQLRSEGFFHRLLGGYGWRTPIHKPGRCGWRAADNQRQPSAGEGRLVGLSEFVSGDDQSPYRQAALFHHSVVRQGCWSAPGVPWRHSAARGCASVFKVLKALNAFSALNAPNALSAFKGLSL